MNNYSNDAQIFKMAAALVVDVSEEEINKMKEIAVALKLKQLFSSGSVNIVD